ncbi:MAG: hypothetical protein ACE5KT_00295 [Methanosarcinales archaeon]
MKIIKESAWYTEIFQEGIEKGRIEEKEQDIILVLKKRFETVPESITQKILEIKSLTKLEELLLQAVTSKDIAEFEKYLNGRSL